MSRRPAFTVIEMVVVLIMVTLLFTLMMPQLSPTRAQLAEQEFWHSMRQNWQRAQATAQIQHRETNIIYKRDNQQILFFTSGRTTIVDIPASMRVVKFGDVRMHSDGYVRPRTFVIDSPSRHRRYLMKIQLAWGGYHLEEEKH
ncbi:type II secretion system protein [Limosilactobacillus sp.]|jgi:competence protein ComGD|uniref:type II secretion system protein n=1 Tax=Limosilactobacillus sp. TaxID=2773925 RepID=UPI0025B7DB9F|nr:type II secretion system protein [Limosilactobacillus sp.]MCH3922457.1 type II secretion system GspH family protein [Limosilactobacillus sp.]MCH3927139.1 type II secretion system GspH family protein [Limosilactobacillus sp.]